MAEGGLDIERWPNVEAWSHRLAALPGYALPYDLIPKKDGRSSLCLCQHELVCRHPSVQQVHWQCQC